MAETCYSKGQKIVLLPEQKRNGTWICRFTIPGLLDSPLRRSYDAPLDAYTTEWEAKTAAFAAAKRLIDAPPEIRLASTPVRAS
jgi:hypothetical protein